MMYIVHIIMGRYTTHQTTNLACIVLIRPRKENCLLRYIESIGRYIIDESSRTNIFLYT